MDLRSNLSKARGLGAAHEGAHHWLAQRVTAVALLFLVVWFVASVIKATSLHGIDGVMYLLSSPVNAIMMVLFLGTAIYHGTLGIKVVIEDYVHCPCGSRVLDIAIKFIAIASIVSVTFAIFFVHVKTYNDAERYQSNFWHGNGGNAAKADETTDAPETSESVGSPALLNGRKNVPPVVEVETPKE